MEKVSSQEDTRLAPGTWPIVAGLMLSMFLVALDGTIVSTAMPSIVGNLGGFNLYAWVPSIYLLATAVSTPIYGKLADLFGRKRILFVGIGLFLAGSMLSGAAPTMVALILFRALQGLGAGAVQPITMTVIGDIFTLEQRARMQGLFSSVWGVSSVVGPLLGGFMVDQVGWRWIFYLNVPVGVLAAAMIGAYFHERAVARRHRLDIFGATLLSVTLSAALLLLIEGGQAWPWFSFQTLLLAVVSLAGMALFARQESHAAEPVVPLDLFRSRIIAVSSLGMLFAGALMVSVSFEVPLYVQGVLGQDALRAGFSLAPMSLGWPLAGAFSGKLALRFGYRATAAVGLLLDIIGTALLLLLGLNSSWLIAAAFSFLIGVGLGLSSTPMIIAVQSAVTWAQRGAATAANMFVRSFGGVVGLAVMGAIINHVAGAYGGSNATNQALGVQSRHQVPPGVLQQIHRVLFTGIHDAYYAALIAAIFGFFTVLFLPGGSAREHVVEETPVMPEPDAELRAARDA